MRTLTLMAAAAALTLAGATAGAAPVNFSVTTNNFIVGSGYGTGGSGLSDTLLDVVFSSVNQQYNFALATVGSSQTFLYGNIAFNEPNPIVPNETDDLGVAATFTFTDPLSGLRAVTATGTAIVGGINDADIDFSINWNPVIVTFAGGVFSISLNTLNFTDNGQSFAQNATITLLSVPEPTSLALAGVALLGAAAAGRRRA